MNREMKNSFIQFLVDFLSFMSYFTAFLALLYVYVICHFTDWGIFGYVLCLSGGAFAGVNAFFYSGKRFDAKEENYYRICKKDCAHVKKCKHWVCKGWDMYHPKNDLV